MARPQTDSVRQYLVEIGKFPLLKAHEEIELARQIQAAIAAEDMPDSLEKAKILAIGKRAKDKMVRHNLRLVASIAKKYIFKAKGLTIQDLIQEGNFGLMRAAEKFDPELGYKFSTYSTWWVKQSITRAIADKGTVIRRPVWFYGHVNRLRRVSRTFSTTYGRYPSDVELAELAGLTLEQLDSTKIFLHSTNVVEADKPIGKEEEQTFWALIGDPEQDPEEFFWELDCKHIADDLLSNLSQREQDILRWRYFDGVTLEECGERLDPPISKERIRQIESRALKKLEKFGRHRNPFKLVGRAPSLIQGRSQLSLR